MTHRVPMPGKYLANAFSLSMITPPATLRVEELSAEAFCQEAKNATSAIGHQGTAQVLSTLCGFNIPVNRVSIQLSRGEEVLVFQLLERLPEGKVLTAEEVQQLISQGKVKFLRVTVL